VSVAWRGAAASLVRSVLRGGARAWLGGADLRAALRTAGRLVTAGRPVTLGYWNASEEGPAAVLRADAGALAALARLGGDAYLSVKLPALGAGPAGLADLLARSDASGIRLHADSLGPEHAEDTLAAFVAAAPGRDLGVTLPGRWRRSPEDARRVAAAGLRVRVVKGEWGDPLPGGPEPRAGFLAVVEALAGRARHVSVATHDAPLAEQAVALLQRAGTPCDLELLHTLPGRRCRRLARRRGLPLRVYVPWGDAVLDAAVEFALARRARWRAWLRDL
jgi:proline dehydrogenase